jgi:hypothetical protein
MTPPRKGLQGTNRHERNRVEHNSCPLLQDQAQPLHIHAMALLHNAHTSAAEAACRTFALLPSMQAMEGITELVYHTTTPSRGHGHEERRARRCTYRSRAIADEGSDGLAVWKHSVSATMPRCSSP